MPILEGYSDFCIGGIVFPIFMTSFMYSLCVGLHGYLYLINTVQWGIIIVMSITVNEDNDVNEILEHCSHPC